MRLIEKIAMPEPELEISDIYLAAYLNLAGCTLSRRRRQGPRVYFIFTNPGGSLDELREAYYSGKAMVKAHSYANEIVGFKEMACSPT